MKILYSFSPFTGMVANLRIKSLYGSVFEPEFPALRAGALSTELPRRIFWPGKNVSSYLIPYTSGPALAPSVIEYEYLTGST